METNSPAWGQSVHDRPHTGRLQHLVSNLESGVWEGPEMSVEALLTNSTMTLPLILKLPLGDWGDGSVVAIALPVVQIQYQVCTLCILPLSVTPVLGDPMPSPGLHGHCMYVVYKHTCKQDTHIHKIMLLACYISHVWSIIMLLWIWAQECVQAELPHASELPREFGKSEHKTPRATPETDTQLFRGGEWFLRLKIQVRWINRPNKWIQRWHAKTGRIYLMDV